MLLPSNANSGDAVAVRAEFLDGGPDARQGAFCNTPGIPFRPAASLVARRRYLAVIPHGRSCENVALRSVERHAGNRRCAEINAQNVHRRTWPARLALRKRSLLPLQQLTVRWPDFVAGRCAPRSAGRAFVDPHD
jgi:hypothetical protein